VPGYDWNGAITNPTVCTPWEKAESNKNVSVRFSRLRDAYEARTENSAMAWTINKFMLLTNMEGALLNYNTHGA
jgi:hypothetical protein